jgi:hypothetical protein
LQLLLFAVHQLAGLPIDKVELRTRLDNRNLRIRLTIASPYRKTNVKKEHASAANCSLPWGGLMLGAILALSLDQTPAAPCCPSPAAFQISFQPLLFN